MLEEVTVAAVRLGRVVAAIEDGRLDRQREILHHRLDVVVGQAADGARGTRKERSQRGAPVGARRGLTLDERGLPGLTEDARRDLAAGVAVDAGGIDEEIARDILG